MLGSGLVAAADSPVDLEKMFKDTHVYRTELKDAEISVTARQGVVTLSGSVEHEDHRRLAEDTARGLPGVTQVNNQLRAAREPQEASDEWIALKVRGALLFHRNVSAADTHVKVDSGLVTLSGTAESEAEKALAGEYAADIKGVSRVDNRMEVVAPNEAGGIDENRALSNDVIPDRDAGGDSEPARRSASHDTDPGTVRNTDISQNRRTMGEHIDDASITAQLKTALAVRRSTSALHAEVTTRDGIVTVSGAANTQAEKDLVSKLAENIDGVRSVRNELDVRGR